MCKKSERNNASIEHMLDQQGEAVFYESCEQSDLLSKLVQAEESARLYKKIHFLSEPYKEVFLLRVLGCLSYKEIGEVFGKSENWGRVTFYRAKKKLSEDIGDDKNG